MVQFSPQLPVPVFPLPNLVLFPDAVVPLHIFELRYRTMVRDALSGERVIAMGLLKPGWEGDYHGSPEYYPLGCLARFEEVEWLPNDCYSLVVRGLGRVMMGRVVREYPYRAAKVEGLPQEPWSGADPLVLSGKYALLHDRTLESPDPTVHPTDPQRTSIAPIPGPAAVACHGAAFDCSSEVIACGLRSGRLPHGELRQRGVFRTFTGDSKRKGRGRPMQSSSGFHASRFRA